MAACASCGTENPDGFRFCGACAAPLAATTPMREERKVVTVLFADLAGFTSRSEALDPEDVRALLLPYYDVLTAEIERHGGHVDRFLGDGVMALFGAPVAHEDDPERAVRAALRILERIPALDLDLHVRLGINTGEVLYASGTGGESDDSVTGDAVNTAARLQAAAPVDTVVVGEATFRAAGHQFRYEELGSIAAKGKTEPVPLWRPLGPISGPVPVLGEERTLFVGRTFELETLVRLYERARATSSLEIVTIVADPGMGKSRLVRELARHVDALPELVTWRVGRCLPYGDAGGFSALGEIMKAHAGIRDTDNQVTLSAKLEAVLTEADPSLRAWIKDRIAPLVGLAVTAAPPQQEEAFTAWRRFLEGIAERGPTVIVVEDLHWADEAMIAFLEHLAGRTADFPLLLVATARPEAGDRHQGWLGRTGSSRTTLRMDALDHEAMGLLLGAALPGVDAALTETVLARAGGSPLFAEQLAAMLREASGQALEASAIPLSVQSLLAARIDALPAEAKALLLDASVIGRRFSSAALIAVSGRDGTAVGGLLMDLARREMVRSVIPTGSDDEDEYAFVHALVRDVAYAALPRAARLARHRATAAWITARLAGHLGPDVEQVVAHLTDARELAAATHTPAVESAAIEAALVTSLLAAADHGMRTQPARAVRHLRRALELVAADDPSRPDVLARLGRAHLAVLDHAAALPVLEEAAEAYRRRGDSIAAAELAVSLGAAVFNHGDAQREEAIVEEARRVLEKHPGPGLVAVLAEQAHIAIQRSHYSDAIGGAHGAIDLALELGLPPPHAALHARGLARIALELGGGEADVRLAVERAEAEGDLRAAAAAFMNLAGELANVSGTAAGTRVADEAIAFCAAHGMPTGAAEVERALVLFAAGAWDEALAKAEAGCAWGTEHRDAWVVTVANGVINRVRIDRGDRTGPLNGFYSEWLGMGFWSTGAASLIAAAALAESEPETALGVLQDAIDRSSPGELEEPASFVRACLRAGSARLAQQALSLGIGLPALATEVVSAEALLAEADGDLPAARNGFASAAEAFARFGNVPEQAHALAGLGRCLLGLGETEEGVARLRESRAIWERLKATPRLAEIDALLAAAPTA